MSKYTEAIEKTLVGIIQNDKIYIETDDEWFDTVEDALEIADRLEQADAELHDTILYDLDRTVGIPNSAIFIQGYNQALADIRGDTE